MIDLVLAGDNAVVIGLAAAGLPSEQRMRAVLFGIVAATVLRVMFAVAATQLLQILGLVLAGGVLLLWVSWKMFRELGWPLEAHPDMRAPAPELGVAAGAPGHAGSKSLRQAVGQIVLADVSMSLDNVLAVAGAARDHVGVLIVGLVASIALMGVAATYIASLLNRHRWIGYVGLAMIVYVAAGMINQGAREVWPVVQAGMAAI